MGAMPRCIIFRSSYTTVVAERSGILVGHVRKRNNSPPPSTPLCRRDLRKQEPLVTTYREKLDRIDAGLRERDPRAIHRGTAS